MQGVILLKLLSQGNWTKAAAGKELRERKGKDSEA